MIYKFSAYGHPNISATHKTTLEFTKDKDVSLRGDCILGVKADFELNKLKELIKQNENKKIKINIETISNKKIKETIFAEISQKFNDDKELVIRKTNFISERTFAINSSKSAFELNRDLIDFLKQKKNKVSVTIENK